MAAYTNDLRLKEIATGDESGTWGTSTNTNLELIAEAFSFGTEAITTNADTHATTIADGSTDEGRSIYLKYTGTLDSACTITLGPNTVSKLWFIENGTSGSQNIIISQGSGANVTIPNGHVKAVYSDGAGSGAAIVDAFTDLNLAGTTTIDVLSASGNATIGGTLGVTGAVTADAGVSIDNITIDGTEIDLSSGNLTVDSAGQILLNADDDGKVFVQDDSVTYGLFENDSSNFVIESRVQDKDILFKGNDGGSGITALTLDMSEAGAATFNSTINNVAIKADTTDFTDSILISQNASTGTLSSALRNVGLGDSVFAALTSADNCTAVGTNALTAVTTGGDNTAVGRNALDALTTGTNSVAIGESALSTVTTSSGNTAVGKDALALATGADNTAVGKKAGDAVVAHTRNTFIGDTAGGAVNSSDNTFVGQNSGSAITSGDANTILGRYNGNESSLDIRTSSNNVVLSDGDGNVRLAINSAPSVLINRYTSNMATFPTAKLVIGGAVASSETPLLQFDDMGTRGAGTKQTIDFIMGRTAVTPDAAKAQIVAHCEGSSATAASHGIGLEFVVGNGDSQNMMLRLRANGSQYHFSTDEVPTSGNPRTGMALVIGPTSSTLGVTGGLTDACVLVNRSGELFAVDHDHNNTQITPHNWGLISDGPSEELAWTYYSQRPNPSNNEEMQTINCDITKVIRKVEDLVGEKLIYTENSEEDGHTFQNIISDIQTTLADLKTRVETLEG